MSSATALDWVEQERLENLHEGVIIADYHNALMHRQTQGTASKQRVLRVAQESKEAEVRRAIAAGVHGYLLQREVPSELADSIYFLSSGQCYLGGGVQRCWLTAATVN
jgi:two-component system NarL family response regulator